MLHQFLYILLIDGRNRVPLGMMLISLFPKVSKVQIVAIPSWWQTEPSVRTLELYHRGSKNQLEVGVMMIMKWKIDVDVDVDVRTMVDTCVPIRIS